MKILFINLILLISIYSNSIAHSPEIFHTHEIQEHDHFHTNYKPQKVTLQLQWKHQFEFAGFYAAKEMGYYKDIGVDVEFLEYSGNESITDSVLNGKAQFGLTYSSLIAEYLNGKPLVFLANYFKQSPLVLVAQKNIKTPKELKNKKVMGVSNNIDSITLKLMLEKFGVTLNNIQNIPTTFNIKAFAEKNVDAMAVFTTNEIYELDQLGVEYNLFNPSLYGHEYYDVNLFTSISFAKNNPSLVQKFKEASNKGWEYALKNKEKIVDLILKKYNSQNKTKESLLFEAKQIEQLMFTKSESIGSIDPQRVKFIAQNLIEAGYADASQLSLLKDFIFKDIQTKTAQKLTFLEKNYLKNHIVKIGMVQDYYPFSYKENGNIHGFSYEYFKLLASKVQMKYDIEINNWSTTLENFKNKKIDIIDAISHTKNREAFTNFSESYFNIPNVIFTRKNSFKNYTGLESLKGKRIGITKGIYYFDIIKNLDLFELVPFESSREKLKALAHGKIDAAFNSLTSGQKYILQGGYTNIEILDEISDTIIKKEDLRLGVTKENQILFSIIQKAQNLITTQEKRDLINSYFRSKKKTLDTNKLLLTKKEQEFIQKQPVIYLGADESWQPYVIKNRYGNITGYDKDILDLVNLRTGANFQLIVGKWDHLVNQAKNKKIAGLSSSTAQENRKKYFNFSKPYMQSSQVIMVSNKNPKQIVSLNDLEGKTIAVQKDNAFDKQTLKNFKNIKVVETQDSKESLELVIKGLVDATIVNETINYYIPYHLLSFVKVVDILKNNQTEIVFSIRKDWNEALSILNKGLNSIQKQEQLQIKNRWFTGKEQSNSTNLKLTEKELNYLYFKDSIKMCVDPDWEPYEEIDENGNHVGLASDFIKLLEKRINKKIELINTKTWQESLEFTRNGKCEILSFLNQTPQREKFLNFTPIIYTEPDVIVAKDEVTYLDGLNSLEGKTIGLIKGYRTDEYIKNNYPNMKIKYVKNYEEGIKLVSLGKIDTVINSLLGTAHLIRKSHLVDIKIAGKIELHNNYRIGVIKDEPILHSILSKAIKTISEKEKEKILSNWISVKFEQGFDYELLWKILILGAILFLIFSYWTYKLKNEINKRILVEKELTKLNSELEDRIQIAIDDIHKKDKTLLQQARLAQMGEMISMIAHQWRQPIGAINSAIIAINFKMEAHKLKNPDSDKNNQELLQYITDKNGNISNYIQFLSTTIDDFRNFFKPDKQPEITTFKEIIDSSLNIVINAIKAKQIDIVLENKSDHELSLYKNEMIQVILNIIKNAEDQLIENSIKSPKIIIETTENSKNYIINISDNGGGIDESIIDNIFDPYFSTKDEKNGTGMGLYMSKMIVEEHNNGKLEVYNTKVGACFSITFPK